MPVGPTVKGTEHPERPTSAVQLTVGAADVAISTIFSSGFCSRIFFNGAGTVFLKHLNDASFVSYVVTASQVLVGEFVAVGGTTNHAGATSGLVINLEL